MVKSKMFAWLVIVVMHYSEKKYLGTLRKFEENSKTTKNSISKVTEDIAGASMPKVNETTDVAFEISEKRFQTRGRWKDAKFGQI